MGTNETVPAASGKDDSAAHKGHPAMTNGLKKGYTKMSNEILEKIMRYDFTKREYKVLLYVFRNGYGYNHEQSACENDTFQIAHDTGLDRSHVTAVLRSLENKNVSKRVNGKILFNRHAEQWKKAETASKDKKPKQPEKEAETAFPDSQNGLIKADILLTVNDIQAPKESIKEKRNPHTPKNGGSLLDELFNKLWATYPKKVGKSLAHIAFKKIKPDQQLFDTMIKAIEEQKRSRDWKKENGQFIPHLSNWLDQARWDDELETSSELGFGLSESTTGVRGYGL